MSRSRKKPSFTIINELSPTASRAPSPTPSSSGRLSPFLGRGFKPPAAQLKHRNSFDSLDYHTKPSVHFSNSLVKQPRSRSSLSLTPRSILHKKTSAENYDSETDVVSRTIRYPNTALKSSNSSLRRSYDLLPFIKPNPRPINLTSSRTYMSHNRLYRSKTNLVLDERLETTNKKPPVNPRSYQKGMLRVVNGSELKPHSPSKIPIPKNSLTGSMDNINLGTDKSTSPKKRSSSLPKKPLNRIRSPSTKSTQTPEIIPTAVNLKKISIKKPLGRTNSTLSTTSTGKPTTKKKVNDKDKPKEKEKEGAEKGKALLKKTFGSLAKNALKKPTGATSEDSDKPADKTAAPPEKEKEEKKEEKKEDTKPAPTPTPSKVISKNDSQKTESTKEESSGHQQLQIQPKSPTKSMLSESIKLKRSFGLGSVSKALTRSFRRKKKEDGSDNESVSEFQSQLTLKRTDSQMSIKVPSTPSLSKFKLKRTPSFKSGGGDTENTGSASGSKKDLSTTTAPSLTIEKTSLLKRQLSNISKKFTDADVTKKLESISHDSRSRVDEKDLEERTLKLKHQEPENKDNTDVPKNEKGEKLIPMTKSNVISMTTAAITAQPVNISTTVTNKLSERADKKERENSAEKQKSTDPPKSAEKRDLSAAKAEVRRALLNMNKPDSAGKPSFAELMKNDQLRKQRSRPGSHRVDTNDDNNNNNNNETTPRQMKKQMVEDERVSERAITEPPDVELESGYIRQSDINSKESDEKTLMRTKSESTMMADGEVNFEYDDEIR